MAVRTWVTPQEVREYSELPAVQSRSEVRLAVDIARAEQDVITYTHNDFAEEALPLAMKTAVLLLAEFYAQNAVTSGQTIKSETFDDYSYTTETVAASIEKLDLAALLEEYVKPNARCGVTLRMRKL